jgi:hypothetical protein
MIAGRIIVCFIAVLFVIQFLPSSQTDDRTYNDDAGEMSFNAVTNDDAGDLTDQGSPVFPALDQQNIALNRFYTKYKIFPGFPVCIYSAYFIDIPTPPPDRTEC